MQMQLYQTINLQILQSVSLAISVSQFLFFIFGLFSSLLYLEGEENCIAPWIEKQSTLGACWREFLISPWHHASVLVWQPESGARYATATCRGLKWWKARAFNSQTARGEGRRGESERENDKKWNRRGESRNIVKDNFISCSTSLAVDAWVCCQSHQTVIRGLWFVFKRGCHVHLKIFLHIFICLMTQINLLGHRSCQQRSQQTNLWGSCTEQYSKLWVSHRPPL